MKKIVYFASLLLFMSCFYFPSSIDSPKSEEEQKENNKIIEFVQDRVKRDTTLSYGEIFLGMPDEDFEKTRYYLSSLDDDDTIIDNNMKEHIVHVHASCLFDSLREINISYYSFSAENFNALRDLYMKKYGPFSLYHVCPNSKDFFFYTPEENVSFKSILLQGDDDIKGFEQTKRPVQVEYIWCWANCCIKLRQNHEEAVDIIYELFDRWGDGKNNSIYFDFILPQKNDTISNADKKRLKESQSI